MIFKYKTMKIICRWVARKAWWQYNSWIPFHNLTKVCAPHGSKETEFHYCTLFLIILLYYSCQDNKMMRALEHSTSDFSIHHILPQAIICYIVRFIKFSPLMSPPPCISVACLVLNLWRLALAIQIFMPLPGCYSHCHRQLSRPKYLPFTPSLLLKYKSWDE